MVRSAALTLILVASAAGATPSQFDLDCTGSDQTYAFGATTAKPYSAHFRIDLATKRWCESDCGAVRPIVQVQEAFLELEPSTDSNTSRGREHYDFTISRTDGRERVSYLVDGPNFYSDTTDAICKIAPFSGFPTLQKQF